MSSVHQKIVKAWQDSGRSLRDVAADAGVPYATAYAFLMGEDSSGKLTTAEKLATALGLRIEVRKTKRS